MKRCALCRYDTLAVFTRHTPYTDTRNRVLYGCPMVAIFSRNIVRNIDQHINRNVDRNIARNIDPEFLKNACRSVKKRCQQLLAANGGHFEQLR